jgi:dUTP pyrophosphatase
MRVNLKIKRLNSDVVLPMYETDGAAGLDLRYYNSNPEVDQDVVVMYSGERKLIPTGLFLEIPKGYEGQIRSRSGSANNLGLFVLNSPGTIDSDYRGEVKVLLMNLGTNKIEIPVGMRIAQLVICPVIVANIIEGDLSETQRGAGGFGSTGVK